MSPVRPCGCTREQVVQQLTHVASISDLVMARRVVPVRLFGRELVEHGIEQHVQPSIRINGVPEVLYTLMEFSGVALGITGCYSVLKPVCQNAMVFWEPLAHPKCVCEQDEVVHLV